MAYMEDQAQEREAIRRQFLGAPRSVGQEDPQAPTPRGVQLPQQSTALLESIAQFLAQSTRPDPSKIKVDQMKGLEVPEMGYGHPSSGESSPYRSGDGGADISGMFDAAKQRALEGMQKVGQKGADVRDRTPAAAERAQRLRDNTPGPYAKGAAATQYVQEKIPGLKPGIDASKAEPGRPAADAYMEQQKPGGAIRMTEKGSTPPATGDRVLPGVDLKGVDPRVAEIVGAAAEGLPPGYKIRPTSGTRATGEGQHTHGKAVDWEIVDPDGKAISNRGDDTTGLYTKLAKNAYGYQEQHHPDLTGQFNWGGAFGTSKANPEEPDLMHFDIGGRRGHITKYSRETIGAEVPPAPAQNPQTPPWDKGLPQTDAKTNWPDPSQTTPSAQLPQPAAPAAPAAPSATSATSAPKAGGVPPELSKLVMSKEWFVDTPKDDYGQKTIGYGTEANGRTSITEPEARAEMNARLQQHLNKIDAEFPNLPPGVRNSVASLTFNVGEGWMSEKGNGLSAALKAGDMGAAKQQFMRYTHVTDHGVKKELPGLVNRRTDEARAFDGQQPLYTKNPDAPPGAQPDVATTQPVEKPAVPAMETAGEVMKERADAAPSATPSATSASVFEKGAQPTPAPGVGGLQEDVEVAGQQPTARTTQDSAGEALNAIQKPETAVASTTPTPAAAVPEAVTPSPPPVVAAPPAVVPPKPPAAAAAPPPPVKYSAPPPPPRAAPPAQAAPVATPPLTASEVKATNPAHRFLDMNTVAFAEHIKKGAGSQVPGMVSGMTVREVVNHPVFGGMAKSQLGEGLKAVGVTQKQFEDAMKEGTPPPQKRSEGTSGSTEFSSRGRTPMAPPGLGGSDPKARQPMTGRDNYRGYGGDSLTPREPETAGGGAYDEFRRAPDIEDRRAADQWSEYHSADAPPPQEYMSRLDAAKEYLQQKYETRFPSPLAKDAGVEVLNRELQGAAPATSSPATPAVTPSIADALVKAVQGEGAPPVNMKPNPEALPVLPATAVAPPQPGAPGGLAPPGLDMTAPGAGPFQTAMGAPGSQGGAISMLGVGVLPPIQNATFSTPLLDSQATQPAIGQGSLSPIPWDTLNSWGWGGGGPSTGIGDFGGFSAGDGGGASMFSGGGGFFPTPMTWGG